MRAIVPFVMVLAACQPSVTSLPPGAGDTALQGEIFLTEPEPFGLNCWARDQIPAVMGKGEGDVLVAPEQRGLDGILLQPAIYRKAQIDVIVEPARPFWFRAPCPPALDNDFVSSGLRALEVRCGYIGPITVVLDARTQAAIRRYQAVQGLDSAVLSLKAAQQLGLANYDLDAF